MNAKEKTTIAIESFVICAVFFLAKVTQNHYFQILGLCIAFLFLCFSNNAVYLLTALIPNTYYCTLGESAICGYMAILVLLRIMVIKKVKINAGLFASLLFLTVSFVLSLTLTNNYSLTMALVKIITFSLLLYFCFKNANNTSRKKEELSRLSFGYIYGAFVFGVLSLAYYHIFGKSVVANDIYSTRYSGLSSDPNYMSAIFCVAISLVFLDYCFFKKTSLFYIVATMVFFLSGLASLSRGFFFTVCLVIIAFLFEVLFSKDYSSKTRFIAVMLLCLTGVLIALTGRTMLSMILERSNDSAYSGGSGRIKLWGWYIRTIFSTPLTALAGCGNAWMSINNGSVGNVEHNTFIQLFFQTGMMGIISFLTLLIAFIDSLADNRKFGLALLIPFLAVVTSYSFLSALNGENFIFTLLLACCAFSCVGKAREDGLNYD